MNILFDYQAFEMQPFGGVSHSYAELIKYLQWEGCNCRIGLMESDNVHLQDEHFRPLHYIHNCFWNAKKIIPGQRTLTKVVFSIMGINNYALDINKIHCIKLLKRRHFDIFEPTFFDSYFLPYLKGKPFVLTVHDMIPEIFGVDEPQAKQKKLLCPHAAHIHVPSENTKKNLVDILNIPPEKVTVIPHGAPISPTAKYPKPYPFPYILYVGARWSYKNFKPFIEECAIIIKRHPEHHIVCTGKPFDKEEQRLINNLGLSEHVIQQYTTEQEMQALYQNAVAFIYPSAYEGFGMPILEAFACGCPVLLNNASCFPEVGGDAVMYFDINRKGELAEQIISIYKAPYETRKDLINRGKERLKLFSWEKSAKELKHIYERLV